MERSNPTHPPGALSVGFAARLNLLVDLLVLVGTILVCARWEAHSHPGAHALVWFGLASIMVWTLTGTALRYYTNDIPRTTLDHTALVTVLVMAETTSLEVVELFQPDSVLPRIAPFTLLLWGVTLALRLFLFRRLQERELPADEVLIVGTSAVGRITGQDMLRGGRRTLVGFLRFSNEPDPAPGSIPSRHLGTAQELEGILRVLPVNEVFIAGNALKQGDEMQHCIRTCEKLGVPFALPAYNFRLERAQPVDKKAIADGFLHYHPHELKPEQLALKRLFDIVASAVALWLLLPLFAFVALGIKLSSRGPVFFKQVRVGLHGKPFHMLKFRSMVVNAEAIKAKLEKMNEQTGPVFKMKNDPRITRIGRFIRKYSIDELPQLVNVLRGDMSVVGPRPPVPSEVDKYEAWQRRRLSVRPGLTCIWQVSGRNQISFEDWMYLDMQYIDHWSLARDLALIFRTIPVVVTGRGAS